MQYQIVRAKLLSGLCAVLLILQMTSATVAVKLDLPHDTVINICSNDTQLRTAVTTPAIGESSTITFACGNGLVTIPISGYMQVAGNITLEGGGKVTLDGGGAQAFFQVFASAKLTLRNLTLQNGKLNSVNPLEIFGEAILESVTVRGNDAGNRGGAVLINGNGKLTARNSIFINNSAAPTNNTPPSGAAIQMNGSAATIEASVFTSNTITGTSGSGGAIDVKSGSVSIANSTFTGNSSFNGGALSIDNGTRVTVTQTSFVSNTAGYGGAIISNGELQVDFSTFRQNQATVGDGGAIWVLNSDTDVTYSSFSNNSATTTGGSISCYGNTLSVIHSTINNNQAGTGGDLKQGGGIFSTCNLNLNNSTLSGNSAASGGGGGLYQTGQAAATVFFVTIANNSAGFGAGVYNDNAGGSTLTLQTTLLVNNKTGNCDGVVASNGYNLADDGNCGALIQTGDQSNVQLPLGPLANNGGTTQTHLPVAGNPALDAIPAASCGAAFDQRDAPRPQNGRCDVGALEVAGVQTVYLPLVQK